MNKLRKQSDTTYPLFFLMVDSTDHVTGKTGLSPTVTISKNGASFSSPSGSVSEVGNGLYKIAGDATDSNTLGELWVHATGTDADPSDCSYTIVTYDPFSGPFPSNMTQINGDDTDGNNAILKLKSLDIRSDDNAVNALDVRGSDGGAGVDGGKAINILGGSSGSGGANGGDAIYLKGGTAQTTRGAGIKIVTPTGGTAIIIDASSSGDGVNINASGRALIMTGGYGCVTVSSSNQGYSALTISAEGTSAPLVKISPTSGGSVYEGIGLYISGKSVGTKITGLTTGDGVVIQGGTSEGSGLIVEGKGTGDAFVVRAQGTAGAGLTIEGRGDDAAVIISAMSGTGAGIEVQTNNGNDIEANLVGSIGSLDTQAKADVNAEVKDVLETDTQAEPTSPPSSTSSLRDKIAWLFTLGKNKRTQTATTETVFADDGTTPIATSEKSDTGGTFTRGKFQ